VGVAVVWVSIAKELSVRMKVRSEGIEMTVVIETDGSGIEVDTFPEPPGKLIIVLELVSGSGVLLVTGGSVTGGSVTGVLLVTGGSVTGVLLVTGGSVTGSVEDVGSSEGITVIVILVPGRETSMELGMTMMLDSGGGVTSLVGASVEPVGSSVAVRLDNMLDSMSDRGGSVALLLPVEEGEEVRVSDSEVVEDSEVETDDEEEALEVADEVPVDSEVEVPVDSEVEVPVDSEVEVAVEVFEVEVPVEEDLVSGSFGVSAGGSTEVAGTSVIFGLSTGSSGFPTGSSARRWALLPTE
jgi:hypothetical protein